MRGTQAKRATGNLWTTPKAEEHNQVANAAETGGSIRRGLLIGLLDIFVILSFQFRGYVEPLIVMLAIPLAFIGAIWGHVLMGYYLSMPSLIGAASLAGIVVNNAILLIQFVSGLHIQHSSEGRAQSRSSRIRRPPGLVCSLSESRSAKGG